MPKTVYLVVSIDTECDKAPDWSLRRPLQFRGITEGIPAILTPLFDRYGIKPTYLLSPEVLANSQAVTTLRSVPNCELGTHLHGEFIEPQADFNATRTATPQFCYPPEVERAKLRNLTDLFTRQFGYSPKSFRAGRFGISTSTLLYLIELGYEVDSSVSPFWSHSFDKVTRNYWGAPYQPYFPAATDIRKVGKLPILQVPVTIYNDTCGHWPRWLLRRVNGKSQLQKRVIRRLGVSFSRTQWLRPQRSTAAQLVKLADQVIANCDGKKPIVLNMMYHNVEVIPGASPYAQTESEVENILNSQAVLFEHLHEHYDLRSIGLSETIHLFRHVH